MVVGKTASKTSPDAPKKAEPVLTNRRCEHCGVQLMSNDISVIKRITVEADGTSTTRMVFNSKKHNIGSSKTGSK